MSKLPPYIITVSIFVTFFWSSFTVSAADNTPSQYCSLFNTTETLRTFSTHPEVISLQKMLNLDPDTRVASFGPGSPGEETTSYGQKTYAAVKRFQEKYREEILTPNNLNTGTGILGQFTKNKLQEKYCSAATSTKNEVDASLPLFTKNLFLGVRDAEVSKLQEFLSTDPLIYPEGLITGYYGSATKAAVGRFQEKYQLGTPATLGFGGVGPKTREKLEEIFGSKQEVVTAPSSAPSMSLTSKAATTSTTTPPLAIVTSSELTLPSTTTETAPIINPPSTSTTNNTIPAQAVGASSITFTSSAMTVHPGMSVTLSWSASLFKSCSTSWGALGLTGQSLILTLLANTTYAVTCTDSNGNNFVKSLTITVGADINTPGAIGNFTIKHSIPGVEYANTSISLGYLNDHTAGARGSIYSQNGHLYLAGQRIRLYGINTCCGSTLPAKTDAEKIAARFKKEGFNAVRMISFDRPVDPNPNPGVPALVSYRQQGILNADLTTFNSTALDYFDYFIHQLEQNGIYVQFVLQNSRTYPGYTDCLNGCRGVNYYVPELVQLQKDFSAQLLNHTNPYTGKAYKDDSGVVALEITNENSLSIVWVQGTLDQYVNSGILYNKYAKPLEGQWETWLQNKYVATSTLATSWSKDISSFENVTIPLYSNKALMSKNEYKDWYAFMANTQKNYLEDMHAYLKNSLGVKSLVYGTQTNYDQPWSRTSMDISDTHAYWGDLGTATGETNPSNGRSVFQIQNKSVLNKNIGSDIANLGAMGIFEGKEYGKPAMVTEYQYRDGNQYMAESEPFMSAYAGFQDLDAIYMFSYHDSNLQDYPYTYPPFNTTVTAVTRVASALSFRRGDVMSGVQNILKKTIDSYLNTIYAQNNLSPSNYHFGGQVRAPYTQNMYTQIVNDPSEEQIITSGGSSEADGFYKTTTGEIRIKLQDRFTVNAPRTKTAFGFFHNMNVNLGTGIDVFIGNTMNNFAVINLTSLDDTGIIPSSKMLLTLAGYFSVPGEWPRTPGQNTFSWGTDTPRVEAVPAKIKIVTNDTYQVTALDSAGERKSDVPVVKGNGYIEFVTGPTYDTGWYLIEKQ